MGPCRFLGAGAPYCPGPRCGILVIALALGVTISLFVLPRLSLILPAIALGERMSLAQAWRATRGNAWRLAMAGLLCSLPPIVPFALLAWHLDESTRASSVLVQTINSLAYVLIVTVAVTLLSLAYRHFVRKQDVGAPPPA